jgi:hypothetical protein
MLKCLVLSSVLLVAFGSAAAAKNTVLHCRGYQVGDQHPVTDQIIALDIENNIAVSIQLGGGNRKTLSTHQ